MQSYCVGPLFLGTGCFTRHGVLISTACVYVCQSEGLLRDVAPVGGVLAQCVCCIATPPHHCNTTGLQLNALTTTYCISLRYTHAHSNRNKHLWSGTLQI